MPLGCLLFFCDLLAQAKGHELFLRTIHSVGAQPPVAFSAKQSYSAHFPIAVQQYVAPSRYHGIGYRGSRGGNGRGCRPPHCQLCHNNGHYASSCPQLASFSTSPPPNDTDLAKAFNAKFSLHPSRPDWYVDSIDIDHMVSSTGSVHICYVW